MLAVCVQIGSENNLNSDHSIFRKHSQPGMREGTAVPLVWHTAPSDAFVECSVPDCQDIPVFGSELTGNKFVLVVLRTEGNIDS